MIGKYAFFSCSSLSSVDIQSNTCVIGFNAFSHCDRLGSGKIGSVSLKMSNDGAELSFSGTGIIQEFPFRSTPWSSFCSDITQIRIGEGITSVGNYAFSDCEKLERISLPSTIESVGFNACPAGITISQSVKRAGECGNDCSATFKDGALAVNGKGEMTNFEEGYLAPWHSLCGSIKQLILSDGVASVGNNAFRGCSSLASVTIPNSVTTIGSGAFRSCSSLKTITIPSSVTVIKNTAFSECSSLETANVPVRFEIQEGDIFEGCPVLKSFNYVK